MNHCLSSDSAVRDWVIKENKAENWTRGAGSWEDWDITVGSGQKHTNTAQRIKERLSRPNKGSQLWQSNPMRLNITFFFLMSHSNLILTKIFMSSDLFPLKKTDALFKLKFHVSHLYIFQETQKFFFFKSFPQVLYCPRFQLSHHLSKDHVQQTSFLFKWCFKNWRSVFFFGGLNFIFMSSQP